MAALIHARNPQTIGQLGCAVPTFRCQLQIALDELAVRILGEQEGAGATPEQIKRRPLNLTAASASASAPFDDLRNRQRPEQKLQVIANTPKVISDRTLRRHDAAPCGTR